METRLEALHLKLLLYQVGLVAILTAYKYVVGVQLQQANVMSKVAQL